MKALMSHNGDTGKLVCATRTGTEVLRTVETDIEKAHLISEAVQAAYKDGWKSGRVALLREVNGFVARNA